MTKEEIIALMADAMGRVATVSQRKYAEVVLEVLIERGIIEMKQFNEGK